MYRYFTDGGPGIYEKFEHHFRHFEGGVLDAVEIVRTHHDGVCQSSWNPGVEGLFSEKSGRPFLLGVDEISKAPSSMQEGVVATLSACLNIDPRFHTVVTSLDVDTVDPPKFRPSGRPLHWIPLAPIRSLDRLLHSLDKDARLLRQREVGLFLSDLGGHPRSLDEVVSFILRNPHCTHTYETLEAALLASTTLRLSEYLDQMTLRRLLPCILARKLPFRWSIDGSTFEKLCASGVYLNSKMPHNESDVPFTSAVILRLFCKQMLQRPNPATDSLEYAIVSLLNQFVDARRALSPSGSLFEQLTAIREALVRCCLAFEQTGATVSLSELYGGGIALHGHTWSPDRVRLKVYPQVTEVRECQQPFPSNAHLSVGWQQLPKYVFRGTHNQPGHDITAVHRSVTDATELIACNVECRFSSVVGESDQLTTTTLTLNEVLDKKCKSDSSYDKLNGLPASVKITPYLLVFAHRHCNVEAGKLPPNVLLFGPEQVRGVFGPTLCSRPEFLRKYAGLLLLSLFFCAAQRTHTYVSVMGLCVRSWLLEFTVLVFPRLLSFVLHKEGWAPCLALVCQVCS